MFVQQSFRMAVCVYQRADKQPWTVSYCQVAAYTKSIKFQATSGLNEDIGEERKLELPGRSLLDAATVRKPWGG